METASEPKAAHPKAIGEVKELAFKNVTFGYKSASTQALTDISYSVVQGKTIAFVGPSGSGKTSMVKLLVGLYEPTSGEIFYNAVRHDEIDKEELRKQIGFVTQDAQLFSGTIRENLLFVSPNATDEECLDALAKAQCNNLLERGGKGLDTVMGEGGVKVSGGEKQRLSISSTFTQAKDFWFLMKRRQHSTLSPKKSAKQSVMFLKLNHTSLFSLLIVSRLSCAPIRSTFSKREQ